MPNRLENMRIAVLVDNGYEQVELDKPVEALKEAGARVDIVSPQGEKVKAWDKDNWGDEREVDVTVDQAQAGAYDALLLPGGVMNPDHLRKNDKAVSFVRDIFNAGKPVAAICHGPWTLIEAGVVEGKKMTSYTSIQTDLKNAGAQWLDERVVKDGNLVTSRKPDDIPAFIDTMIEEFASAKDTVKA